MINNRIISLVFKTILIFLSSVVIYEYMLYWHNNMLAYFTILSNILVFIVFIIIWLLTLKDVIVNKQYEGKNEYMLIGKCTTTIAIIVTFLVYAFVLADYSSKDNYDIHNLLEHYILPIMVIVDFFLFDKKGKIKWYHPIIWIGCIIIYIPYIFIRATIISNKIGYIKYPYFFLDLDKLGVSGVALWCLGLFVFFSLLGYGLFLFDKLYHKKHINLDK